MIDAPESSKEQHIANHLTELLDFLGQGLYSLDYQAPQSTPGSERRGNRTERWQQEGVSCLGRRVTSFS